LIDLLTAIALKKPRQFAGLECIIQSRNYRWESDIAPVTKKSLVLPDTNSALPDRAEAIQAAAEHVVSANRFVEPLPEHLDKAAFGLVCFWAPKDFFGS